MKEMKIALIVLLILTCLTGGLYPLLVAGIAQTLFPWQANGSLLMQDNQLIGSALIGQSFTNERHFWGRPSATPDFPYNATHSAGSNLGPGNPELLEAVKNRILFLQQKNPNAPATIPIELVTTSASGLDPDITLKGAYYQMARISKARGISEAELKKLIDQCKIAPALQFLGQERVNVLQLNLALDQRENKPHAERRT